MMTRLRFERRLAGLQREHKRLILRRNRKVAGGNGVFSRYLYPVLTADHTPLFWRYDLNYDSNPYLMEQMGISSTFNLGAIELNGKILLAVRVEGVDRSSFFAIAESANGIDNFRFWDYPIQPPETDNPDVNLIIIATWGDNMRTIQERCHQGEATCPYLRCILITAAMVGQTCPSGSVVLQHFGNTGCIFWGVNNPKSPKSLGQTYLSHQETCFLDGLSPKEFSKLEHHREALKKRSSSLLKTSPLCAML